MTRPPLPAEHLIHGLDGPVIVVSGRVASLLVARAGLAQYHRDHRGQDPELDNTLVALKVAAAAWRANLTGPGQQPPPRVATSEDPTSGVGTVEAAHRLDCSPRTVRRAIAAGQLTATRISARWVIDPADVEHYRTTRTAA